MTTLEMRQRNAKPMKLASAVSRYIRNIGLPVACGIAICSGHQSAPSVAADCPKDLWSAGKLRLTDASGQQSTIEALDANSVRRIDPPTPAGLTSRLISFKGLFVDRVVTMQGNKVLATLVHNVAPADRERLERFVPLKVGSTLTLDYDIVPDNGTGAPAQPAAPNRRMTATYTVKGQVDHEVGPCRYRAFNIILESKNGDGTRSSRADVLFVPELATQLKTSAVGKNTGKADFIYEKAIVAISTVSPTDLDR